MEFGRHINKGFWAFADKSLTVIYGLGVALLVIRVLPEKEYGAYVIIQAVLTLTTALGFALALQPLTKFVAEHEEPGPYVVVAFALLAVVFTLVSVPMMFFKGVVARVFDPHAQADLGVLLNYIPLLLATAFYRNLAVSFLQARFEVKKIFWIDAIYFLGVLLLVFVSQKLNLFHTAEDMLSIMVLMYSCSTVYAILATYRQMAFRFSSDLKTFREVWNFGKYTFAGNALYTVYAQLDVFFISAFVGVAGVAVYNAAKTLSRLFDAFGQVLSMFLLPYSAKHYATKEVSQLSAVAEKSIWFSTIALFPVLLLLLIFPQEILHILYKGKYDESANILRIFSLLALLLPWNVVFSCYLTGIGEVRKGFFIGVIHVTAAVITFSAGSYFGGILGVAAAYVLSFTFYTWMLYTVTTRFVPVKLANVVGRTKDISSFLRRWLN